jgi:hypothetical protein
MKKMLKIFDSTHGLGVACKVPCRRYFGTGVTELLVM